MEHLRKLSETEIRSLFGNTIFTRGVQYWKEGAVYSLNVRNDRILEAEVQGSKIYDVNISFRKGKLEGFNCSCPYDGYCKHGVATLLAYLHETIKIFNPVDIQMRLNELDHEQIKLLLSALIKSQPKLVKNIEQLIEQTKRGKIVENSPIIIDKTALRKRAKNENEIPIILDEVMELCDQHQTEIALEMLQIVTPAYLDSLASYEAGYEEDWGYFEELGKTWAYVIVRIENLSNLLKLKLISELEKLDERIEEYIGNGFLENALFILEYDWNFEPLVKVLRGESTDSPWKGVEVTKYMSDEITLLYLDVLDDQQRDEEYLRLAHVEEYWLEYSSKLFQLGSINEALENALEFIKEENKALELAQQAYEQNFHLEAINFADQILQRGFEKKDHFEYQKTLLASWLSDAAYSSKQNEIALRATLIVCKENPSIKMYHRAKELAKEHEWKTIQQNLLQYYKKNASLDEGLVEILATEHAFNLLKDITEKSIAKSIDGKLKALSSVFEVIFPHYPEWVLRTARILARQCIEKKKSESYNEAAKYLKYVRAAFQQLNQLAEWNQYYENLCLEHSRKRRLIEILNSSKYF